MAIHENSLSNLQRGNNPGYKKQLTKSLQSDIVDKLANDRDKFYSMFAQLQPREYCEVYISLMKLVLPKNIDVEVTDAASIDWNIIEFVGPTVIPKPLTE